MYIRPADLDDIQELLKIQEKDSEYYWKKEDFLKSIGDENVVFLVSEDDEGLTGYTIGYVVPTKRKEAMVHETRVDLDKRKQGIGKNLMKSLTEELFKIGVEVIYIESDKDHLPFYKDACSYEVSGAWVELKKEKE